MEKKLKKQWIKALRSGDYDQTAFDLKNDEGYCCLGVLCEIMGADVRGDYGGYARAGTVRIRDDGMIRYPGDTRWRAIPGLTGEAQSKLVKMNDAGVDFDIIADYIEVCL